MDAKTYSERLQSLRGHIDYPAEKLAKLWLDFLANQAREAAEAKRREKAIADNFWL